MIPKLALSPENSESWVRIAFRRAPELLMGSDFSKNSLFSRFAARLFKLQPKPLPAGEESSRVLEIYLRTPRLWEKYPLALLRAGRPAFFRWLIKHGRRSYALSDCEILSFLHEADREPPAFLLYTYLLQTSWQQAFPKVMDDSASLLGWIWKNKLSAISMAALSEAIASVHPPVRSRSGINLLGHFCYCSGLREAVLQTQRALAISGYATACRDIPGGKKNDLDPRSPFLATEIFPVSIIHLTPNPFYESTYRRAGLHPAKHIYRIGICSWELPEIPWPWLAGTAWLDEVWAPTRFIFDALQNAGVPNGHLMLPGVELTPFPQLSRAEFGLSAEATLYLFMFDMGSVMERKNPLGLIRAFRRAFPEKNPAQQLVIKVSHGNSQPADLKKLRLACQENDVRLLDATFSRERAYALLDLADVYVSLHRSEGFGISMAEAMLLGKPVIATGYSGNLDFMHSGNSLLVDAGRSTVGIDDPNYPADGIWADPDLEHAARHLRWTAEHPEAARALGAIAQKDTRALLSLANSARRMSTRLAQIAAARKNPADPVPPRPAGSSMAAF